MVHTSSSSFTLHLPLSRRDWTSCNLPSLAASSRSLSREALAAACVICSSQSMKENGRYMTEVRVRPGTYIIKDHIIMVKNQITGGYTILLVSLVLGRNKCQQTRKIKRNFSWCVSSLSSLVLDSVSFTHIVVRLRGPFWRWHKLKWKNKRKYIFVTCWEVTS